MSEKSTILFAGPIALLLAVSVPAFAQTSATANWPLTSAASTMTVSGNISASPEVILGLTPAYEIPGAGTSNAVQKLKPDATTSGSGGTGSWPADSAANGGRYVQFSIGPQTNFNLTVDSISVLIGAKGVHNLNASVYYSTSSTFIDSVKIMERDSLISNAVSDTTLDSLKIPVTNGQTLYIRIYPWAKEGIASNTKYLYVGNLTIYGSAQPLPVPTAAVWPDSTDLNPVTTGLIVAKQQSFSSTLYSYGFGLLGTTQGDEILTTPAKSTWPAESAPDSAYYVQYAATVAPGGTLFVDSLSLQMGAKYSKNLRAAVYYSNDSTFSTRTVLVQDTSLSESQFTTFGSIIPTDTVGTGQVFYLRVYPYDTKAEGYAKIVFLANVVIAGYTTGVSASLPSITTTVPSYISTTFAYSGGLISSDGGGLVTGRGVCWSVQQTPTIADSTTQDGTGTGPFTSNITNLTPGITYYVAAYATNIAGTAYGVVDSFTTLSSVVPPSVTTAGVTQVLAKTAQGGGSVTSWGGDSVKVRGVCYSVQSSPTVADSVTVDGSGLGTFVSGLANLTPATTYYVRAYATNSAGTGYGSVDTLTTQPTAPTVIKVVAQDGSGDYKTIQAAFDAVPDYYTGEWIIYVKNGSYYEKDTLAASKTNVVLEGESRDSTILTYDDYSGRVVGNTTIGTSSSFTLDVAASDFTAENITIQNTSQAAQAVAVMNNGDRQVFYHCNILGYQDTYYNWGGSGVGRIYNKDCLIQGSVDFMFGRDIVVTDSCIIHEIRNGGTLTAANTNATTNFGYVFLNDSILVDSVGFDGNPITSFYLGRPWQAAPRVAFIHCYEPAALNTAGWLAWNVTPALYAEYNCYGPGSDTTGRVSFSTQLDSAEAANYTLANIFSKTSDPGLAYDWMPVIPPYLMPTGIKEKDPLPQNFELYQNYPNPFNPTTTIEYSIPRNLKVTVEIYDVLGQRVATLSNQYESAGYHSVVFNADKLSSGVYFYQVRAGNNVAVKKLMLIK